MRLCRTAPISETRQILCFCLILTCCSCSSPNEQHSSQVAIASWPHGNSTDIRCEIHERHSGSDELSDRELRIVDPRGHCVSLFHTPDTFLAMYPNGDDNPLLITVWVSGTAYRIRVVNWDGATARVVLDGGSKSFPEIISRELGDCIILLSDSNGSPTDTTNWTTTRYSWNGNEMSELDHVAYSSRFAKLQ